MTDFVTKKDLQELEARMISGHYSDVLKSNQELKERVCSSNKVMNEKLDMLIQQIQPILDAQKLVTTLHSFFKWLGIPFTGLGFLIWWVWGKL